MLRNKSKNLKYLPFTHNLNRRGERVFYKIPATGVKSFERGLTYWKVDPDLPQETYRGDVKGNNENSLV
jgi:hypothetical protein